MSSSSSSSASEIPPPPISPAQPQPQPQPPSILRVRSTSAAAPPEAASGAANASAAAAAETAIPSNFTVPALLQCEFSDSCKVPAFIHCAACGASYCLAHDSEDHSNQKRSAHVRSLRQFPCDANNSHSAQVFCFSCDAPGLFCFACDLSEHKHQKRQHHKRIAMKSYQTSVNHAQPNTNSNSPQPIHQVTTTAAASVAAKSSSLSSPRSILNRPKSVSFNVSDVDSVNSTSIPPPNRPPPARVGSIVGPAGTVAFSPIVENRDRARAQSETVPPSQFKTIKPSQSQVANEILRPASPTQPINQSRSSVSMSHEHFPSTLTDSLASIDLDSLQRLTSLASAAEVQQIVRALPIELQSAIIKKGTELVAESQNKSKPATKDPLYTQRNSVFDQIRSRSASEAVNLVRTLPADIQAAILAGGIQQNQQQQTSEEKAVKDKYPNNPRLVVRTRTQSSMFLDGILTNNNNPVNVLSEPSSPIGSKNQSPRQSEPSSPRLNSSLSAHPNPASRRSKSLVSRVIERVDVINRILVSPEVRAFVRLGMTVIRHKKGNAREYFLYSHLNDEYICFMKGNTRPSGFVPLEKRFHLSNFISIRLGRSTEALQKKTLFGKFIVPEEKCFNILCRRDVDKTDFELDLECESEELRDKLAEAIKQMAAAQARDQFTKFAVTKIITLNDQPDNNNNQTNNIPPPPIEDFIPPPPEI